jgi:cystathionine beta-lyase
MSDLFDRVIDRQASDSAKWRCYGDDVLPLWVADMDFRAPEPVIRALHERVEHGIFGYGADPSQLREVIVARLQALYNWQVSADALVFLSGVVAGINLSCQAVVSPGAGALLTPPVYPPILKAPALAGLQAHELELIPDRDGRYGMDFDAFEESAGEKRAFLLCNPHNPVGRVFRRDELERMAEICLRHGMTICSDEIHCDLLFDGRQHIPIAALAPEVADRTITLMAPSKTYNIPGLQCAVAIVPNRDLRCRLEAAGHGLTAHANILGVVAALAAYTQGDQWLAECLAYLQANRDFLGAYVERHLSGVTLSPTEGTYLAWLDCRDAGVPGNPHRFFLRQARVALNDGKTFGPGGEGFVRLNFGCPRATLVSALDRMAEALRHSGDAEISDDETATA